MQPLRQNREPFPDRFSSGLALASGIRRRVDIQNSVVIGLARGGVPVAYSVAKSLDAPLDVLVVRKLGVPWHKELAFGAIAPDGIRILNQDIIQGAQLHQKDIKAAEEEERAELERRERTYRDGLPAVSVTGKTVLFVDDGLATGATMLAALEWARQKGAIQCIVAVPVASKSACEEIERRSHNTVCICHMVPDPFYAVGSWYEDFSQVDDETVLKLLRRRRAERKHKEITGERDYEQNENNLDTRSKQNKSKIFRIIKN